MKDNPKVTLVPIKLHFDADGKPSCRGCPFEYTDYGTHLSPIVVRCAFLTGGEADSPEHQIPSCPVHFPETTKGAL